MNGIPQFGGEILRPRDSGYDHARLVWNGAIDRRPAVIARCRSAGDVAAAVGYATAVGLPIAVRGGGHGVAGHAVCDGGLVIDCSPMRNIRVDPLRRTVLAQAGCRWGDVDAASQRAGLAVPGGIVSHTGIAGLTLGGGIGWLMREHGLTADNLLSAAVVTAGGEHLRCDAGSHPDLFWALRGGGGNFGVVTDFEYQAHPAGPDVLAGPVLWPLADAPDVLRRYRDWIASAPGKLTTIVKLAPAPALPAIPAGLRGRPTVTVTCCYTGPAGDGERLLRPMRGFGRPLLDLIKLRPYLEQQAANDPTVPHGWCYYWRSAQTGELTDELIELLVKHTSVITSPRSYTLIFQLGGAVSAVAEDATAYSHRTAAHAVNVNAAWLPGDPEPERHREWARAAHAALEPFEEGVYVNFLGDEGPDRVRAAYGPGKLTRLRSVKGRYDPGNVFSGNQNIPPTTPER